MMAVVTVSLKLDGYADYTWLSALWPFWVAISLLILISIGVLLLLVGSLCSWIMKECEATEVICSLWLLWTTAGLSATFGLTLLVFANVMDGNLPDSALLQAAVLPVVFLLIFLVWTRTLETRLVAWWDSFFTPEEVESEIVAFTTIAPTPTANRSRHISRQFTTLIASAPKMMTRISSTFFRPAKGRRERRTRPQSVVNPQIFVKNGEDPKVLSVSTLEMDNDEDVSQGEISEKPKQSKPCLVCYESLSNSVIMPCGHSGICSQCSVLVWKQTGLCHLCRKPIESVLEIKEIGGDVAKVVKATCEKEREDVKKAEVGSQV